jgi:hypothetical protein
MPHIRSLSTILLLTLLPLGVLSAPSPAIAPPPPGFDQLGESSSGVLEQVQELTQGLKVERRRTHHHSEPRADQQEEEEQRYFQIHPGYDESKCLDVRESGWEDGTPVDM